MLNDAITNSLVSEDDAFKSFVETFGTHYVKHAKFGAKLYYEKKYNSRSRNSEEKNDRNDCTVSSAKGCVEGSIPIVPVERDDDEDDEEGGLLPSVSAKACAGEDTKKCHVSHNVAKLNGVLY